MPGQHHDVSPGMHDGDVCEAVQNLPGAGLFHQIIGTPFLVYPMVHPAHSWALARSSFL